ncbi:MAG: phosphomannomutase/phosphoglucomutase [Nitrospirae bacterium]|nr:MAG: phosphomannomutase/phosphoglucomutase [Nitrospirota bacterium]
MSIFREYDIRGVVGEELTPALAEKIGRAYGSLAVRAGAKAVAVARDGRTSAMQMREALLKGLLDCGLDVVDIGVCPTPLMYFSLFTLPVEGGVMITASHNPAAYNGFKLCLGRDSMHGAAIQSLKTDIDKGKFETGQGAVSEHPIIPDYMAYIKKSFAHVKADKLHAVVDCGNGMGGLAGPDALRLLGCRVTGLYEDVDGRFPNHHPDPTVVANLQDLITKVRETKADVGVAYDGDADRIGAVDEKGQIIWGDKLMVLFSRDVLKSRPGATIISEVKASQVLFDDIAKHGGRPIMGKVGHSLIKAKMKEEKAALAGEMSGHMFFADRYFGYDDAIYASCRLIEILAKAGRPFSTLLADLPPTVATPEIRVDCPDDIKFQVVEEAKKQLAREHKIIDIDGVRVLFPEGWGLIRASNTQPALVLRFEATSEAALQKIRDVVESQVRKYVAGGPAAH